MNALNICILIIILSLNSITNRQPDDMMKYCQMLVFKSTLLQCLAWRQFATDAAEGGKSDNSLWCRTHVQIVKLIVVRQCIHRSLFRTLSSQH
jgi:hypothetical protein